MKRFSILTAGGGSTYTPGIVLVPLSYLNRFPLRSIEFYDNDADRQRIVTDACEVLIRERNPEISFLATVDPGTAFTNVDLVMTHIHAGKYIMRKLGEKIPMKYSVVGQETCGPGEIAYGTRSIGAILELVDYMEKCSLQAQMLNYSNPVATVAEATGEPHPDPRIFDICDMPIDIKRHMAGVLHPDSRENMDIPYCELNHSGWWTSIKDHAGDDLMLVLKEHIGERGYCVKVRMYRHTDDGWTDIFRKVRDVYVLNPDTLPSTYLKHYSYPGYVVEHTDLVYTRANRVMGGRGKFISRECRRIAEAQGSEGADLHIDEHISYIVDPACALAYSTEEKTLLVVESNGAVQSFDPTVMAEALRLVRSGGPQALRIGDIPRLQKELIKQQVAIEKLVVEAWAEQSYQKLWQALTLSRVVPSASVVKAILDDLIEVDKDYWPGLR